MIANISHTETVKPLIEYNEKKVKKGEAERIFYNGFDSEASKESVISHFVVHTRESKRKDKNMHISLNFPVDDLKKIDNDLLTKISKDYLKELGFPEGHPLIIYRHFDSFQPHIHIVTPKIISKKTIINDSNLFLRSQKITRELEQKYELKEVSSLKNKIVSVPDNIFVDGVIEDTLDKRKRYSYAVDYILKHFHPTTMDEYNVQLNKVGLEVISNNYVDKNNEIKIGLKYKTKGISDLPLNSSALYSNPGQKKLDKVFLRNLKFRKKREGEIKDYIENRIFSKYNTLTHDIFIEEMNKIDIEVSFTLKNGIPAAYRFYDKREGLFIKPSDIARSLSYGNVKDKFSEKTVRDYKYHNATLVFVLEKKYKELYPEKTKENNPQHYIMFMALNGMIPDVKGGKLRFNHYLNKNPKDIEYSEPVKIQLNKIDFSEVSNLVHAKDYKSKVWKFQQYLRNDAKSTINKEDSKTESLTEKLNKAVDQLLTLFEKNQEVKTAVKGPKNKI
ncbi:relaxase/mobilization nuclease domain-containing protein [Chryseobacterium oncorhynchi]|uniref:relaxase/mobilization nuclease domain-containing protein n=1 Tax=Chryseobacterium oncorhynchi TaxID=741074 RepID=UPI001403CA3B|nr:relaxase/mobilization nuclease domain-containing protein [Chryseobacterium oncorhynchi]